MWKYNPNLKVWNRTVRIGFCATEFSISYDENLRFHYLNWEVNGEKKEKTLHVTDIDSAKEIADAYISIKF